MEALQFVQAEQRETLGSHQTVECSQNKGNSALQQLKWGQIFLNRWATFDRPMCGVNFSRLFFNTKQKKSNTLSDYTLSRKKELD